MQVLLRHVGTGLYVQDFGQWTDQRAKARNFVNSSTAINHAIRNQLREVEILFDFGDPSYDVHLMFQGGPSRA